MSNTVISGTIRISIKEYKELKEKAKVLEDIIDEEGLTESELKKIRKAEKSKTLTEIAARRKYPAFFK